MEQTQTIIFYISHTTEIGMCSMCTGVTGVLQFVLTTGVNYDQPVLGLQNTLYVHKGMLQAMCFDNIVSSSLM